MLVILMLVAVWSKTKTLGHKELEERTRASRGGGSTVPVLGQKFHSLLFRHSYGSTVRQIIRNYLHPAHIF